MDKYKKKVYILEDDTGSPCMKDWAGAENLTLGAALYAGDHILRRQDFSLSQKITMTAKCRVTFSKVI